jgi:hypothetical protein
MSVAVPKKTMRVLFEVLFWCDVEAETEQEGMQLARDHPWDWDDSRVTDQYVEGVVLEEGIVVPLEEEEELARSR